VEKVRYHPADYPLCQSRIYTTTGCVQPRENEAGKATEWRDAPRLKGGFKFGTLLSKALVRHLCPTERFLSNAGYS